MAAFETPQSDLQDQRGDKAIPGKVYPAFRVSHPFAKKPAKGWDNKLWVQQSWNCG